MEKSEQEKIERAVKNNVLLKKLYSEHQVLEEKITKLGNRNYLTEMEQAELRKLKFKKLAGKEKMLGILASVDELSQQAA